MNFRSSNYLIGHLPNVEASFIHDCYNPFVSLLDQVANDLIVKIFNILPSYPFLLVFLLLLFQNQFYDRIFVITIVNDVCLSI